MEPKVVRAGDAHNISLYDVSFRYGVGSAESDGGLSMLEVTIPPKRSSSRICTRSRTNSRSS